MRKEGRARTHSMQHAGCIILVAYLHYITPLSAGTTYDYFVESEKQTIRNEPQALRLRL